jgi:hypothetical protein
VIAVRPAARDVEEQVHLGGGEGVERHGRILRERRLRPALSVMPMIEASGKPC